MVTVWTSVSASVFVALALAHSVMGEQALIRPLLSASWSIPIPRWAANRLIRFAWHATSVAWLGLAAIVVGVQPVAVVSVVGAVSAVVAAAFLRGHFSWPLFLLAGLAAGVESGLLGPTALTALAGAGIMTLLAAAGVHVYWALGGRRWYDLVLPQAQDGTSAFTPGRMLTLAVAGAMVVQAAAMFVSVSQADPPLLVLLVTGGGGVVMAIRAVGDGKQAGFTKTDRSTTFARLDDLVFTPLVVLLSLAALCAVLVAVLP